MLRIFLKNYLIKNIKKNNKYYLTIVHIIRVSNTSVLHFFDASLL